MKEFLKTGPFSRRSLYQYILIFRTLRHGSVDAFDTIAQPFERTGQRAGLVSRGFKVSMTFVSYCWIFGLEAGDLGELIHEARKVLQRGQLREKNHHLGILVSSQLGMPEN